ncbi:hypothetical protein B0H13DRAFT_1851002 [Mycena leptocephala]|nr:hypothetical protein B0H13DRAFT_1851002 [Mycena leptocephala]
MTATTLRWVLTCLSISGRTGRENLEGELALGDEIGMCPGGISIGVIRQKRVILRRERYAGSKPELQTGDIVNVTLQGLQPGRRPTVSKDILKSLSRARMVEQVVIESVVSPAIEFRAGTFLPAREVEVVLVTMDPDETEVSRIEVVRRSKEARKERTDKGKSRKGGAVDKSSDEGGEAQEKKKRGPKGEEEKGKKAVKCMERDEDAVLARMKNGDNELTVPVVKKAKTTVTKKAAPKNPATTAAKQGLRRRQNLALAKLHKARLATKAKDEGKRPKSLSMAVIQAAHSNESVTSMKWASICVHVHPWSRCTSLVDGERCMREVAEPLGVDVSGGPERMAAAWAAVALRRGACAAVEAQG